MAGIIKKLLQTDTTPSAVKATTAPSENSRLSKSGADLRRMLKRPVVTEKSVAAGVQNTYVFEVVSTANKITIARAVAAVYGIKPVAVRTLPVHSRRRVRGRIIGRTGAWKKAMVTLPKGKSITMVEGV